MQLTQQIKTSLIIQSVLTSPDVHVLLLIMITMMLLMHKLLIGSRHLRYHTIPSPRFLATAQLELYPKSPIRHSIVGRHPTFFPEGSSEDI